MPLREDLLTPIPGDNPGGTDLRYELYDIVREARREEIDAPTGGWDRPRKTADWALVAKETSNALATKSKDLQLAVWLIEASYHRESFAGFAAAAWIAGGDAEVPTGGAGYVRDQACGACHQKISDSFHDVGMSRCFR